MNNIGKNVDSMNFEELRSFVKVLANDVQELSDLYAKTTREYNDMLYNLSRENLSVEYLNEQDAMFIKTENGYKSVIAREITNLREFTDEELTNATEVTSSEQFTDIKKIYKIPIPGTLGAFTYYYYYEPLDLWVPISSLKHQRFSTIEQTDNKIAFSVSSAVIGIESELNKYSTIEQTDDKIASAVEEVKSSIGQPDLTEYTKIEQTADAITQTAYRGLDLSNAEQVTDEIQMDNPEQIYYFTDGSTRTYYAYNSAVSKFMPIIDGQSIYTIFEQTAEGFKFKGDVNVYGKLSGVEYSDIENEATLKLSAEDSNGNPYPALVYVEEKTEPNKDKELFKVYFDDAGTVYLVLNSASIGYVGVDKQDFYATGKWIFKGDVDGLGVVPVFG
jgi:hypothetical protein